MNALLLDDFQPQEFLLASLWRPVAISSSRRLSLEYDKKELLEKRIHLTRRDLYHLAKRKIEFEG